MSPTQHKVGLVCLVSGTFGMTFMIWLFPLGLISYLAGLGLLFLQKDRLLEKIGWTLGTLGFVAMYWLLTFY